MSSQATIDRVRNPIAELLGAALTKVAMAARGDLEASEFYDILLSRTVQALGAAGGALWLISAEGHCEIARQLNLDRSELLLNEKLRQRHGQALFHIVRSGTPQIVAPDAQDDNAFANSTDFVLLLGPLVIDKRVEGILEVFQHAVVPEEVQAKHLRYVQQMCGLANDYLRTSRLREFAIRQTLWGQIEGLTREVYQGLDLRATCFAIVNEGRRLIGCDRLSLVVKRRGRFKLEAVSGQDAVNSRATAVSLLNRLTTAACAAGDEVWYSGDARDLPPQLERELQAYIDESHSATLTIIPIRPPVRPVEGEEEPKPQPIVGALIAETFNDRELGEGYRRRVAVTAEHSARALANVKQYDDLFLMPVWRTLGKLRLVTKARSFPLWASIGAAVAVFFAAICIIPCDFEVSGKGTLEPVVKRDVFADLSGTVSEIDVERGHVRAGDQLAVIDSTDVKTELLRLEGERDAKLQEQMAKERQVKDVKLSEADKTRLWSEVEGLKAQIVGLHERIQLVTTEKAARAIVTSPLDGDVITWQVRDKLDHRPVEKGQVLMTVAALDQPWNLEVKLPEDRIGHLDEALEALPALSTMRVSFILASDPGRRHEGTVREIHRIAEVQGEDGNVVLVRVDIDKNELKELRPGAGVTAKFYCGRRSIAYVWFHDVLAFIQAKILF